MKIKGPLVPWTVLQRRPTSVMPTEAWNMEVNRATRTVGQVGSYTRLKERKYHEPIKKGDRTHRGLFPDML